MIQRNGVRVFIFGVIACLVLGGTAVQAQNLG